MKVLFENSYGERRELADVNTFVEGWKVITDFLDAHNYKFYYSRTWQEDGMTKIDVGSHTEFFYFKR